MRIAVLALFLVAPPAAACPWHGSTGHSPWGISRYGMGGALPFEEPPPSLATQAPPSREEAVAALRAQLLATTPALKPQSAPDKSASNSAR
jgi:hypothetical protein